MTTQQIWIALYLYDFIQVECRTVEDIILWYEVADEEINGSPI